ncbi:MAG: SDR family oxidoreductase [Actinobacteria bacterium]|nr:SDR family oxidoreductase [Actinomycetota bacterium]
MDKARRHRRRFAARARRRRTGEVPTVSREHRRVVVITGAGAGIGRATARRFAADGDRVALLARGEEELEGAAREIEAAGGTPLVVPTDVADPAAVEDAAARVERELGPIDIWVSNAMATVFARFPDITPEEFRRATDVTYHGAVWSTRSALCRMEARDRGTIVLVGSALAYQGIPLQSPYCGAKHAIKGFFDSVRTELRSRGSKVQVTMVQLPGLNTPQFDHGRSKVPGHPRPVAPVYQPEVAAEAIHFAACHRRRQIYVGISTYYTVLGSKLAPWIAERYLAKTAVSGQQTDAPPGPQNREGNLMRPPPGDPGAHGPFDGQAHGRSAAWFATRHRTALAAGALAGVAALAAARARRLSPRG